MTKKLTLIATVLGVVATCAMTIVTKLDFNYSWIVVLVIGLINDICNIIIDYIAGKNNFVLGRKK